MQFAQKMRDLPGVLLRDFLRFRKAFRYSGKDFRAHPQGWIGLRNRIEHLTPNPKGLGVHCDWLWGSDLHACGVLTSLGRRLMQLSIEEWPIKFVDNCPKFPDFEISFIFSHAGMERLPLLNQTLRSLFAQKDISFEVIVIDQSKVPVVAELPAGIRYHHLPKTNVPEGWHKAWGYNVGAHLAQGKLLVFHDGDICVPCFYGRELSKQFETGNWDALSMQRFLYYLPRKMTAEILKSDQIRCSEAPERVFQNWKGGTIAISKEAFFSIGGFDEGFVDWGGEDDEFYHRCSAIRHFTFGYIPFVHLWHAPQPDRKVTTNPNISKILPWRLEIPATDRIKELSIRQFGNSQRPDPLHSYKSRYD
jgi:hypothetical protein